MSAGTQNRRIFCPRCGAGNFAGERACWRCAGALPPPEMIFGTSASAGRTLPTAVKLVICPLAAACAFLAVWHSIGHGQVNAPLPAPPVAPSPAEAWGPDLSGGSGAAHNAVSPHQPISPDLTAPDVGTGRVITSQPLADDVGTPSDPGVATGPMASRPLKMQVDGSSDPVVMQARRAIEQARASMGRSQAVSGFLPGGDVRIKPGATLKR